MADGAEFFAGDWLAIREPADQAARSRELAREAAVWLDDRSMLRVIDLGAGSGSNPRWLAPLLPQEQQWTLLDHDAELLEAVESSPRPVDANGRPIGLETRRIDLTVVPDDVFAGADLVTASALFDLVSRDWLEDLAGRLASLNAAALFALTVDGRRRFVDPNGRPVGNEFDRRMERLFNHHQRRAKGLGDAMGPAAASELPALLEAAGLRVRVDTADWRLAAGQAEAVPLGLALLSDWTSAAIEQSRDEAVRIRAWHRRRRAELEVGKIGLLVGHVDVLALPQSRD